VLSGGRQVLGRAGLAQAEVRAQPVSDLEHHDRVGVRVSGRGAAGRAPDVLRQHLGCLVAEPAEQLSGAGGDPQGEAVGIVLAELQLADPRQ